ncbi:sporulation protein YqfC [Sporomusaceae bacterium BoRhaA]|uniref:sporulation protein YqfC n=1 Tax=Pelorhabdus rhamnosifermentans TaxID=2772457 RepID=UPI001C0634A7|nr:sporulation protein YqfC [Pelorhabdus rhamnosifermentans]MBU2701502.1 sporulation protein YqfC [Pelorhabdus rhamnosifermentans]
MGRNKKNNLLVLANLLELPDDIVLDLPRMTMLGNKQLLVENHKGIIEYSTVLVRIKLSQGTLIIHGEQLSLGNLQQEQILVEGIIKLVQYDL